MSLDELWKRVDRSIQEKKTNKIKRDLSISRSDKKDKGNQGRTSNNDASGKSGRSVFDKTSKGKLSISYQELTPLNAIRSQVLVVIKQQNLGNLASKITAKMKRNSNLYAYHKT